MATAERAAQQRRFIDEISSFVQHRRKVFIFLAILIIAGLIGLVIVLQIRKNRQEASLIRLEAVEKQQAEWISAREEADKENAEADVVSNAQTLETELIEAAEALVREYKGLYAQMRAYDILASAAFTKKEYEKAARLWTDLAGEHAQSYFAPLALLNAAAAWEEAGNQDRAVEALTEILEKFSTTFPDIPRVLSLLGWFAENSQRFEDAKTYYNRLIDEYQGSSWTKLAHNRIIRLQIENKISK
ncbi:MAG: tetratricopeptide repeat protein [Spirochaetales bacterium]|jgi:predicted negative regulator of RcsB-dependent stress response|nr:tetratricopeptide repeat protein [Spirochaetales bacterium]